MSWIVNRLNDEAMFSFLILTQLAISPQTTMDVVNTESSHKFQVTLTDVKKMHKAFPVVSSITADSQPKQLLEETIASAILERLIAQAILPSDNAPVLLPSSKDVESPTLPSQASTSDTIVARGHIDKPINTQGDKFEPNDNQQHNKILVF